MKNIFTSVRSKSVALVVASMALATQAHAALPAWATTAATELGDTVDSYEGLVGPIILAVTAALVGIKLFKRFTAKI
ncbi:MAG: hypothetical protein EOO52_19985 [Gammaproteobacteria bacterium]|nr:MAG: hypothetical protein EOO52_19985 [Gammaproteobacteria bacterium]